MQISQHRIGVIADMNVVPLIDILLVLLIIFMAVTPTMPKGLEALLPQPANPPVTPERISTIVVQVLDNGSVRINEKEQTWDGLGPRLETIFKDRGEKVAFVKGGDAVQFSSIARAIDIMRQAGIDKVGLITAKLEAGKS